MGVASVKGDERDDRRAGRVAPAVGPRGHDRGADGAGGEWSALPCRGTTHRRAERAPPAGEAPPGQAGTEPEGALLALLVEVAWRCWRTAAGENDDEHDSTDPLRAPGLRLRAPINPRPGRASPREHRAPVLLERITGRRFIRRLLSEPFFACYALLRSVLPVVLPRLPYG
jgi:hypothetical protein